MRVQWKGGPAPVEEGWGTVGGSGQLQTGDSGEIGARVNAPWVGKGGAETPASRSARPERGVRLDYYHLPCPESLNRGRDFVPTQDLEPEFHLRPRRRQDTKVFWVGVDPR